MNFLSVINFLWDCGEGAGGIGPIIKLATTAVHILQFAIPIALIIFGMIDLGKAVIAGKEDEMKKAQGTLIRRFIYAVLIFFIVTLVGFVMSIVGETAGDQSNGNPNWSQCWNQYW